MEIMKFESDKKRIEDAKQFLAENPSENMTAAARIFKVPYTTLKNSIYRESRETQPNSKAKWGGQNKILQEHQVEAIHNFIRSLLKHSIQPTHGLVFNAIKQLKQAQDPEFNGPSKRWFRKWWQQNKLHKIKTKPLSTVRFSAAQVSDIENWFDKYVDVLKELNIKKRKNIINFDEAGCRVGCMKGQEILVPIDISEFYSVSPENRRSITIFESINANGDFPPPPLLVIQGRDIMLSWFHKDLPEGTKILTSENGSTSDEIGVEYLRHYIRNSDAGPESDWKLLLMDNHGSHMTPEFILLANENHICPFPLIPHLTHCMQPLDVGIFQPYKHWHEIAIEKAIAEFEMEYSISRLCQDLGKIRIQTFKNSTIRSAFEKSGMWPVNKEKCIHQLRKYSNTQKRDDHRQKRKRGLEAPVEMHMHEDLPLPRTHPKTLEEIEQGLKEWMPKIQNHTEWSDPIRPQELEEFVQHTKGLVAESTLNQYELALYRHRRSEDLAHKASSRKRVKVNHQAGNSGLTKEDAERIIEERDRKSSLAEQKKKHNEFMKMWRMERDDVHAKGVIARKAEKARVKNIKELMKQNAAIPEELLIPIEDPEAKWKAENEIWKAKEVRKQNAKNKGTPNQNENPEGGNDEEYEENEVTFIIDTEGDRNLSRFLQGGNSAEDAQDTQGAQNAFQTQQDFIAFDDDEDENEDEDEDDEIQHLIDDY